MFALFIPLVETEAARSTTATEVVDLVATYVLGECVGVFYAVICVGGN